MTDEDFTTELSAFIAANIPQIERHGGHFQVDSASPNAGRVEVSLMGACFGCGLFPMTESALQSQIQAEFSEISEVSVRVINPADFSADSPF